MLSIQGLAKPLPIIVPTPPADDGATGFDRALNAASASNDKAPPTKTPVGKPPPDENLPIRNGPDSVKAAPDRQAIAGDGKDEPTDDADGKPTTRTADPENLVAMPMWATILPVSTPPPAIVVNPAATSPSGQAGIIKPSASGPDRSQAAESIPSTEVVPGMTDVSATKVGAAPGFAIPIAKVPVPAADASALRATASDSVLAATPPVVAPRTDTTAATSMTGGALAAAAVHAAAATAHSGGGGSAGGDRPSASRSALIVDATDQAVASAMLAQPVVDAAPAAPAAAPTADAVLDTRDPAWMATLVDKMVEARDANGSRAISMTLRPDALGAVEVSLRHSAGQLHVVFTAADAGARSLLGDARSQLAALAADRGVALASATVIGGGAAADGGASGRPDHRPAGTPFADRASARADTADADPESPPSTRILRERTA